MNNLSKSKNKLLYRFLTVYGKLKFTDFNDTKTNMCYMFRALLTGIWWISVIIVVGILISGFLLEAPVTYALSLIYGTTISYIENGKTVYHSFFMPGSSLFFGSSLIWGLFFAVVMFAILNALREYIRDKMPASIKYRKTRKPVDTTSSWYLFKQMIKGYKDKICVMVNITE